ncbi:transcriptional regulator with XRE-family HTH domain [Anaerotaenia torta]|uniref:helix-turn-helix domain-containing protein n=1 Tax=Anaerotaenia torta TaxID=433293 RepID=UPI003D25B4EF
MINRREFGAAIRNARLENKLTQEKLAEILEVTPIHIKQLEAGSRMPSLELLHSIAVVLNFSVDDAFFPAEEKNMDMLNKLQRKLLLCNSHELRVVYATASALIDKEAGASVL